jgi:hypothetical protein
VYLALLLLASRIACARPLSLYLAHPVAVSHCGDRRGWCFVVFEISFFPPGANFARTTRDLTKRPCLWDSNSKAMLRNVPVLAAKWVFLEGLAQFWEARSAVETLWKQFCPKESSARMLHHIEVTRQEKYLVNY